METMTAVLILLVAVVVSGGIGRFVPWLPQPLIQVALGALLGGASGVPITLDPGLFLLLFIPPLLFLDAWRFPSVELRRLGGIILTLAVGLVMFTVVGAGHIIHWLLPGLPLATSFALAAVLSPTDAVAVSGMTGRAPMPARLRHILEGEALLNDASGLVCLQFAVTAALTGTFSLGAATGAFLWAAVGGLIVGVVTVAAVHLVQDWVIRTRGDHAALTILTMLLVPFAAYLAAEHLAMSGILAAVAAGMTLNLLPLEEAGQVATRLQGTAVADMVQFTLNGVIFVLLGWQLPGILGQAPAIAVQAGAPHGGPADTPVGLGWLGLHVLFIVGALLGLRLLWVWLSLWITRALARRLGRPRQNRPSVRLIIVTAVAGVRGAVTLAGVLSLPEWLRDGVPFPGRDVAVFLACGVILVSLPLAGVLLPWLLRGLAMPEEDASVEEERLAEAAMARAALRRLEQAHQAVPPTAPDSDLYAEAAVRLMEFYRRQVEEPDMPGDARAQSRRRQTIDAELRLVAVRAKRDELARLHRVHAVSDDTWRRIMHSLDMMEASLARARVR
ncbi:Na+/H+ antiporter [Nitrospirillum iridis]|uniref:CPA1 family monovalent cation:H+ antiporter n=1 Tax=Nitrospirillum iridis TaxID=765888 RepID=A0A7X0AX26_9PROT|nr:Na+/H+ antiporter [Nitrospirillum iridis]MBB6251663.1 CPA1 family monovalent cation:H+ antiporter [Nitrospirillum iridis]